MTEQARKKFRVAIEQLLVDHALDLDGLYHALAEELRHDIQTSDWTPDDDDTKASMVSAARHLDEAGLDYYASTK